MGTKNGPFRSKGTRFRIFIQDALFSCGFRLTVSTIGKVELVSNVQRDDQMLRARNWQDLRPVEFSTIDHPLVICTCPRNRW